MTTSTPIPTAGRTAPDGGQASPVDRPEHVRTEVPQVGRRVHARAWRGGSGGAPVVLVHGLGLSSRYFVPLGRRLAALGHDVLAPDLPGFGRSRRPAGSRWPGAPDVAEQAGHLRAWMDAAGIGRAVLFGNSVGVQVAVELATRHPDRVERLVLSGPTPDPAYRTAARQYPRVLRNMVFEKPSLNPLFQLEYLSTGIPRVVQHLLRTVDDPIEERLPRVQVPVLVIRGRHDQTLSQEWAEQFTRLLPDGRLVVVEGAAHNVHYSAPGITAELTDAFLAGRLDAQDEDEVLPREERPDQQALRPQLPAPAHAALDYLTAGALLTVPGLLGWGPRTRALLATFGVWGLVDSVLTDHPGGVRRTIPLPVHLNLEASGGVQLLLAAATVLRGEPSAERRAVALQGALEILRAMATRTPAGPARLVVPARG